MSNSSIWCIERTLSGTTTQGQSGPRSNGNEGVVLVPQSSSITGASPSDCSMLYHEHSSVVVVIGGSYPSAEMQMQSEFFNFSRLSSWFMCTVYLREEFQKRLFLNIWNFCWYSTQNSAWSLAFSKVNFCGVPKILIPEQKVSYCSKNSGKPLFSLVENGLAATSTLQFHFGPFWVSLFSLFQRISVRNNVFKWRWRKELYEQMFKNSVQRFLCWRNRKNCFFLREKCFIEILLKNILIIFLG